VRWVLKKGLGYSASWDKRGGGSLRGSRKIWAGGGGNKKLTKIGGCGSRDDPDELGLVIEKEVN